MKLNLAKRVIAVLSAVVMLAGCGPKENIIGPRTEDAWKKWEQEQAELKEKWGDTEVYAYIQTIMDDILNVNANVVFKEDFSVDAESEELDALKKLYEDMGYNNEMTLEEFLAKLNDSSLRWSIGSPLDLDKIEEKENGEYAVTLLDYPNADSLMNVYLTVKTNEDGSFRTEFE